MPGSQADVDRIVEAVGKEISSNYIDLYGAGNGYDDVKRVSIMATNCSDYATYPDQMATDTMTYRGIKLGDSREMVIAAYGEPQNEVVYKSKSYNHDGLQSQYNLCYRYGACEDEVGGIEISTGPSPIERRVGAACAVAKWNMGG